MTAIPAPGGVVLTVSDRALAIVVAHAAAGTPGVVRLRPRPMQAARSAVADAVTRAGGQLARRRGQPGPDTANPARSPGGDPDAVQIEHPTGGTDNPGGTVVTVNLVTSTEPPVRVTVQAAQQRIVEAVAAMTGARIDVVVHVMDVEPAEHSSVVVG